MLRDEVIKLVQDCLAILKEQKGYDFELLSIDDGKPTSDYDEEKLGENKTVFHITISFNNPEGSNQNSFELTKIIPNDFTEEDKLEKGKGILKECNKAAKDFMAGREYEPTYMEQLRTIFKLSGMLGGNGDWYI